MDKNEIIRKIAEKLNCDEDMLRKVGELTLDKDDCCIAEEQKPETMYVLTSCIKVAGDEKHHYHPIIKDCLFNPEATENSMVASPNLIELQKEQGEYCIPLSGVEYVILAVPYETYQKLQQDLDETIANVIANVRHAAEEFMKNAKYTANGMLSFESIYRDILYQLMFMSKTIIGSALNEQSQIVDKICDVEYDGLELPSIEEYEDDCDCDDDFDDDCDEDDDCGPCGRCCCGPW